MHILYILKVSAFLLTDKYQMAYFTVKDTTRVRAVLFKKQYLLGDKWVNLFCSKLKSYLDIKKDTDQYPLVGRYVAANSHSEYLNLKL